MTTASGSRIRVQEIAYHRNGVSGEGFYVVTFTERRLNLVGVLFPTPEDDGCHTAVFDRDLLARGVIEFAVNSWRGDRYDAELRAAIAAWEEARS